MKFSAVICKLRLRIVKEIKEHLSVSEIHGVKHIVDDRLHLLERAFWLTMISAALFGAIYVNWTQFSRYQKKPTVMVIERDYKDWNGTLPAVILCYKNRVNATRANEFVLMKWNVTEADDEYYYFFNFISSLINASLDNYENITRFSDDERFSELDLFEIFQNVNSYQHNISIFDDSLSVDVQLLMTERGMCYSINSLISGVLNKRITERIEHSRKEPISCHYGKRHCFMEIYLAENEVSVFTLFPYEAFSVDSEMVNLEDSDKVNIIYRVIETVASDSLRELSKNQRKCIFPDEPYDDIPMYSKSYCLIKCRIETALHLCNCVPFFYPFSNGPFCTVAEIACLQDFGWPVWALSVCECPQKCFSNDYSLNKVIKTNWETAYDIFDHGDVITLKIDMIPPTTRMRRNVLYSFEDFLVSIGGAMTLFIGFSIWHICDAGYRVVESSIYCFR